MKKTCRECNKNKNLEEFYTDKGFPRNECKECKKIKMREYQKRIVFEGIGK